MEFMKRKYQTPKAFMLNYCYNEQVTADSLKPSYGGWIGTIYEGFAFCQMGVTADNMTSCDTYFTPDEVGKKCETDVMPMSLF